MTTPDERLRAIVQTRHFLEDLCEDSMTRTVPEAVQKESRRLLRHYPGDEVLHVATLALPRWLAWREVPKRFRNPDKLEAP